MEFKDVNCQVSQQTMCAHALFCLLVDVLIPRGVPAIMQAVFVSSCDDE